MIAYANGNGMKVTVDVVLTGVSQAKAANRTPTSRPYDGRGPAEDAYDPQDPQRHHKTWELRKDELLPLAWEASGYLPTWTRVPRPR